MMRYDGTLEPSAIQGESFRARAPKRGEVRVTRSYLALLMPGLSRTLAELLP